MACDEAGGTGVVSRADTDAVVNEPDGAPLDWDQVNWRSVERDVLRLRRRIFAAERAGDSARVASLQKLMLRSRSNVLVSVRRSRSTTLAVSRPGLTGRSR
jgi:RNA-directed DNA polymerase